MNNATTTATRSFCGTALLVASLVVFNSTSGVHAATPDRPDAMSSDGGRYYGPLRDGMHHGFGKIEWDNGARYEGGFENGLFSGKGKFRTAAGNLYEGDFKNGMMTGQGRFVEADGSIYVGGFQDDQYEGHGRFEIADGGVYEGMFHQGRMEGQGKFKTASEQYQGGFKSGQYAGQGELQYEKGGKYKGEFVKNQFHGKGLFESADGQSYEGDFDKGEFTGTGEYKNRHGVRYAGAFVKWRQHGPGTFTDAAGNEYEGTFDNDDLSGLGRMTGKDGSRYEGGFENWKFHGQGVYRSANGDEYKGAFEYGMFSGQGTYTYARPQKDGRTSQSGLWKYGRLTDPEEGKKTLANVEIALYNQRALLDQALAAVAPHEPDRINMYLLAVAGDGSQEVFRREVEYVKNQFDRDFDTRGRSLVLVNSRTTVADYPMATLPSIRESLKGMAGRMDKDKDILFLFLTSHGSKEHALSLNQNGMSLRPLQASELGALIRETGLRWKVIVVSACYAGGFIDSLKDDHTLVLTAARHDRTSFGCADDNDFTYFGRAFFHESLAGSLSFDEAFEKARTLIAEWETRDAKVDGKIGEPLHSEPQIQGTRLIRQHLTRTPARRAAPGTGALALGPPECQRQRPQAGAQTAAVALATGGASLSTC